MISPVTTEVIRGVLTYAAEEMGIALRNAAYSPNIKERMDHSCTIFDDKQRLAAQAEHIPVHLGSMIIAVREGLKHWKGDLQEGDMLVFNDPYISGTHLPDVTVIAPIFYKNEVVAYAANKAHHSDVGGRAPGSMAPDVTELLQEGIIIPPVRLIERGKLNREVISIITRNVRMPKVTLGDLRAQVAANNLATKRVIEVIKRYGVEHTHDAVESFMDHSERILRYRIKEMPEGKYVAEDYMESSGVEDRLVKLMVTVTVKGSELKVDYSGTERQIDGNINAPYGVTLSGVYYTLKCITDPELHVNDGCYRPVTVYAPEGTVLNVRPPAAVAGGNVETSQRNADLLLAAFAQIVPDRVCAGCQGTMNNTLIGGYDPEAGQLWSYYETVGGGFGGRHGLDGENGIHSHMTNTLNTPIEAYESHHPVRVISYKLRENSCGAGKWRGGAGVERSVMLLAPSATLTIVAERNKIAPKGYFGGKDGGKGEYTIVRSDGAIERLPSKITVRLNKGDVLTARTPGGGGYGDPLQRDPKLVMMDVKDGLVSVEEAKREYGLIIDRNSWTI